MKNFLTILILGLGLVFVSCAGDGLPEPQYTNEADPRYLIPGEYKKTQGYKFQEGFIYHEWKGQKAYIKYVPFNFSYRPYQGLNYVTSPVWAVKKIVSSKYFDIYIDATVGQPAYKKALTIKDTVWDKLIKDLERFYYKITNVYGAPTDVDGNGKIEIVFHENADYGMTTNHGGYFAEENVKKGYSRTGNMDIIYVNSYHYIINNMQIFSTDAKRTIIHEMQHDIEAKRTFSSLYCYNEALSESTYPVILDDKHAWRSGDFIDSRNGQYFFDWDRNSPIIPANYRTAANFMYWLYIQSGGYHIIKDIVSVSKSKYKQIDHKSIEDAANRNIIQFVGKDYNTIIYNWYRANFYNKPSGILGYQNKATISLSLANEPSGQITLKPKCAVYTTQDMFDKNKNIPYIVVEKLYDKGKNWLLIFNSGSDNRTVYINPRVYFSMSEARSHSGEEKELELYDQVYYLDEYEHFEGEDLPPEEINE